MVEVNTILYYTLYSLNESMIVMKMIYFELLSKSDIFLEQYN